MIGAPWNHPGRAPHVVAFALATIGALSANERVQSAIAIVAWATMFVAAAVIGVQPGFFAR